MTTARAIAFKAACAYARTTVTAWRDGAPAAWTTATDPEWDETDRALVLALAEYRADLCPGCGMPQSDYLHEVGKPAPKLTLNYSVCTACVAKQRVLDQQKALDDRIEKSGGVVYREARRWLFAPKT